MVYLNMCSIPSTTISLARLNRLKLRLLTEFWIRTTRWLTTLTCRASLGSCSCECLSCKESARSSHPHIFLPLILLPALILTSSHLPSSRACSRPSPSASSRPSLCLSRPHLFPASPSSNDPQVGKEMLCLSQQPREEEGDAPGFNFLMELLRGDH